MGCGASTGGGAQSAGPVPAQKPSEQKKYYDGDGNEITDPVMIAYMNGDLMPMVEQAMQEEGNMVMDEKNCGQGTYEDELSTPRAQVRWLLKKGLVVPCEYHGPLQMGRYHKGVMGQPWSGYCTQKTYEAFEEKQGTLFHKYVVKKGGWQYLGEACATVRGFSVEWAVEQTIGGQKGPDSASLKHLVTTARLEMSRAFTSAVSMQSGGGALRDSPEFAEATYKLKKPRHEGVTDMSSLYTKALGALPGLWDLVLATLKASGDKDAIMYRDFAGPTWSVKKPRRVMYKVEHKYGGDWARVTDVARATVIFTEIEYLVEATRFLLKQPNMCGYKNRYATPTPEQYHDMLFNFNIDGHIIEIQLETRKLVEAKHKVHWMYKVCRLELVKEMEDETWWQGCIVSPYGTEELGRILAAGGAAGYAQ